MSASLRKFALIIHITTSVGWIGSVFAYLALVLAAIIKSDNLTLLSAWLMMEVLGYFMILPLGIASLLTGLIMSLGTKWGLFKHYWVLLSLGLTLFALAILYQHLPTISGFAVIASEFESGHLEHLRAGLSGELFHAGLGVMVLIVIQVLNVYKPRGLTPYGWRKQQEQRISEA
jgi:hypothetical protein